MTAQKTHMVYATFRDRMGVTDYSVAKATGIAPSTLCDWGKGRYTPKADKLILIAQFLDMPVTAFFE